MSSIFRIITHCVSVQIMSSAYLRFFDCGGVAVTHWANVKVPLALHVSLMKELFHKPIDPLLVDLQWFGRTTQV